jgi:hypothetical protein
VALKVFDGVRFLIHKVRAWNIMLSEERFISQLKSPAVFQGKEEFSDPAFCLTREEERHPSLAIRYCLTVRDSQGRYFVVYIPYCQWDYFRIGFRDLGFRQCDSLEIPGEALGMYGS